MVKKYLILIYRDYKTNCVNPKINQYDRIINWLIWIMKYINKEDIAKAIRSGECINIEDILDEFKNMLKEVYNTATKVELTSHLGYEKNSKSDNPNYRNGYNKKHKNQSMVK